MNDNFKYGIKTLVLVVMIILLTHTVFFIVYSYCMTGDAFLALRNFYNLTYNIGI